MPSSQNQHGGSQNNCELTHTHGKPHNGSSTGTWSYSGRSQWLESNGHWSRACPICAPHTMSNWENGASPARMLLQRVVCCRNLMWVLMILLYYYVYMWGICRQCSTTKQRRPSTWQPSMTYERKLQQHKQLLQGMSIEWKHKQWKHLMQERLNPII